MTEEPREAKPEPVVVHLPPLDMQGEDPLQPYPEPQDKQDPDKEDS